MVLDSTSNDEALSWSNIFHDELLEHSSVNVTNIALKTKSWHTEGVETISSSQVHFLLLGEWIKLGQVIKKGMGLSIL